MIANSRLAELGAFLDFAATVLAPKLFTFHKALMTAGFSEADATGLTNHVLSAVIAVPTPIEQPTLP